MQVLHVLEREREKEADTTQASESSRLKEKGFAVVVIYADCVGVAAFNDRLRVLHPTATTTSHRQSEAQAKAAARVAATVASSWHLRCGVCIGLSNLYSKEDGRGRQRQQQKKRRNNIRKMK